MGSEVLDDSAGRVSAVMGAWLGGAAVPMRRAVESRESRGRVGPERALA